MEPLIYPNFDRVALSLGPINVYWYGVMYMLAFLFFLYGGKWRIRKYGHPHLTPQFFDGFLVYGILGVLIGGRLGNCLFYSPGYYFANPLEFFKVWNGGMAFHGGAIGVLVAVYIYAGRHKCGFFEITDVCIPLVPVGLFFGRIGNCINGELWGRIATIKIPFLMIYPQSGSMLPRYPSDIYEVLGEGVLLTIIMWVYASKPRKTAQVSAVFLLGYGLIRFFLEFFREPDAFLFASGLKLGLSVGQWLELPMIIAGLVIFYLGSKNKLA